MAVDNYKLNQTINDFFLSTTGITGASITSVIPSPFSASFYGVIVNTGTGRGTGGCLLLQVPNGDSPFAGTIYWSDATHETNFTVVSLRHFLEAAGYDDLRFQESYPPPLGWRWTVRWALWRVLRAGISLCHRIETGGVATNHYSRVIRVIARKS